MHIIIVPYHNHNNIQNRNFQKVTLTASRMSGYQSIPSAALESVENGVPSMASTDHSTLSSASPPSATSPLSTPSTVTFKLAYVSLGIIVGVVSSKGLMRWGPAANVDNYNYAQASAASSFLPRNSKINGKSFLDSLPFETVMPQSWNPAMPRPYRQIDEGPGNTSWNPAQPRPHQEELPDISTSSIGISGAWTRQAEIATISEEVHEELIAEETSMLAASTLGGSSSSSFISNTATVTSSTTSTAGPHVLYHAHQSAFGLLYDSTKSSNNYLSEYSLDYFLLNAGGFDAQVNQAYCAVATVAAVLNSLKYAKRFRDAGDITGWSFDLPVDPRYDPYPYATQQDVLMSDCVWNTVIEHGDHTDGGEHGGNVDGIFKPPYGLSLEQSGKLLKCHTSEEWDVTVQEVDTSQLTLSRMRYDLKSALIDPDARVYINYDRKALGQVGGGHFSPLGSYHAATDSFLVVDVAKYKYPPVWVGADTLYSSMATVDSCGTYDYPKGQERLNDSKSDGNSNKLFNPLTQEEYKRALEVLNCKSKMRGYIILKKKN